MMKAIRFITLTVLAGAALVCSTLPAHAQLLINGNTYTAGYTTPLYSSEKFGTKPAGLQNGTIGTDTELFVDDDYNTATPHSTTTSCGIGCTTTHEPTWTITAWHATTLTTTSAVDQTEFGTKIGVEGYAELANLASSMFLYGANNPSATFGAGTSIDGVNVSGLTSGSVMTALSEAIWFISNQGASSNASHITGSTYFIGTSAISGLAKSLVQAVFAQYGSALSGYTSGQLAAAIAGLSGDTGIWFLTPTGSGFPESIVQNFAVPEGGAPFMYLLLAAGICFGAMFRKRIQLGRHQAV